ncbi:MAG: DUF3667 domain-containing protein [Flavobacterium sp. JAD_PAG50586_2]|nr:MAG: DUF3667 domain-containing protein [Flavobacterium sp. JAD_PAG50586_2]
MSRANTCLNCGLPISGKFCNNCGQKTDTQRITFKHFIFHDILHGVWHFEKGILFTIQQTLLRPGKAALEYIEGKRIRYYNVFYLILLLIGLNIFLTHYYEELNHVYNYIPTTDIKNDIGKRFDDFLGQNAKILIYLFVPFFAFNSFLIFRRKKLNFSEHFIVAGITFLAIMILTTIGNILFFFDFTNSLQLISELANTFVPILILLYVIFSYYTAFKEDYTLIGFIIRMLLFIMLMIIQLAIMLILIFGYVTDWEFGHLKY